MKKKLPILLLIIAIVISLILIIPSHISANDGGSLPAEEPNENLVIKINEGDSDSPTKITVCATDAPEGVWFYEFFILKYPGTIEELDGEPAPEDFIVYNNDGFFTILEEGGSDCHSYSVQLGKGHYFAMVFVFGEDGDTSPTDVAGVGYMQFTPSNSIISIEQNDREELVAWNYKGFTVKEAEEPEPWVRGDRDMVCYQVWVNEDDCFEFVFWYEYADNNWVKIYDMEGNMVWETDMEYGDARIQACLADGTYMVKTFHDQPEPLQEFIIAK